MRKERMNDKGFSLVELIIVIAIMAILIVVLAPQYLKYVERSRNSTDLQNATTMKTAVETYAADPQAATSFTSGATFDIEISSTGGTVTAGAAADALTDAALKVDEIKCSSKTKWTTYKMHGVVENNGSITWTYTPASFDASMKGIS